MKGRTACFIKEPLLVAKANTGKKPTFYVLRIQKVLLFLTGTFLELEIVFYHRFLHLSLIKLSQNSGLLSITFCENQTRIRVA